jgi:amidase
MTHNLTGWPAAVVRAGTSPDGLPIGVQIAAAPWRDDIVLALAQRIEKSSFEQPGRQVTLQTGEIGNRSSEARLSI